MNFRLIIQVFVLLLLAFPAWGANKSSQVSESWPAEIIALTPQKQLEEQIFRLSFYTDDLVVEPEKDGEYLTVKGFITGTYEGLLINKKLVKVEKGFFQQKIKLKDIKRVITVKVADKSDNVYKVLYKVMPLEATRLRTLRSYLSFGFSSLDYSQNGISQFQEKAFNLQGRATYTFVRKKMDLDFNARYIGAAAISNGDYIVRYWGLNLLAGKEVTKWNSPFKVFVRGGAYYNTSRGEIAFTNMYGPAVSTEIVRGLDNDRRIAASFLYGAAFYQRSIPLTSNFEVNFNLRYYLKKNFFGLDYSRLSLKTDKDTSNISSLGGHVGFSF